MLKKQTVTKIELLYGIAFFVLLSLVLPSNSYTKYMAWYNSKNPENILDGCLYYIGKSNINSGRGGFYRMKIEKFTEKHDLNIISIGSPMANDSKKSEAFFKKIVRENLPKQKCYKVKYVTGRFSYLKMAYLYDVIE